MICIFFYFALFLCCAAVGQRKGLRVARGDQPVQCSPITVTRIHGSVFCKVVESKKARSLPPVFDCLTKYLWVRYAFSLILTSALVRLQSREAVARPLGGAPALRQST